MVTAIDNVFSYILCPPWRRIAKNIGTIDFRVRVVQLVLLFCVTIL